jgi:hypothetical protein
MAKVAEHLSSKHDTLSSNSNTNKKRGREAYKYWFVLFL